MSNLHARQQSNAVERNNHMVVKVPAMPIKASIPAPIKVAVTDKTM